jgi:hypothetical protein
MAEIKFACTHCHQHITCDELWSGHEIQCPICQGTLSVPTAAPPAAASTNPLAPKVPHGTGPRLSIGQAKTEAASAPPRSIPVRNLTPPPPPKKNPLLKYVYVALTLAVIGGGVYFGLPYLKQWQDKANAKRDAEAARNSGESQVGHIAALNNVLDATEPGGPGLGSLSKETRSSPRRPRAGTDAGEVAVPAPDGSPGAAPAAAEKQLPIIPAIWTMDLARAKIPEGRANGMVSGTNFVVDTARLDPSGATQLLRLFQGPMASPDLEVLVYLRLKPAERVGGLKLDISEDMKGFGVPQVAKRWKTNPKLAPQIKPFFNGYTMKLELGPLTNDVVGGKIFLALPDPEQSVVAGVFRATNGLMNPLAQASPYTPASAPVNPGMTPAMRDRYRLGR